jgi:hypothetical protein
MKGKKCLFSALSKAKDHLGSVKRSQVDHNSTRHHSSTQFDRLWAPSPSYGKVSETSNVSNVQSSLPEMHPMQEVPCNASLHNALALVSDVIPSMAYLEIYEEGLLLAQWRKWHIGIPMLLQYRQCDDVLPQPLPSGPFSQTVQELELSSNANSINTSPGTPPLLPAPPFHTVRNVFGLVWALTPLCKSHLSQLYCLIVCVCSVQVQTTHLSTLSMIF